jgi:hypothetical protein
MPSKNLWNNQLRTLLERRENLKKKRSSLLHSPSLGHCCWSSECQKCRPNIDKCKRIDREIELNDIDISHTCLHDQGSRRVESPSETGCGTYVWYECKICRSVIKRC